MKKAIVLATSQTLQHFLFPLAKLKPKLALNFLAKFRHFQLLFVIGIRAFLVEVITSQQIMAKTKKTIKFRTERRYPP